MPDVNRSMIPPRHLNAINARSCKFLVDTFNRTNMGLACKMLISRNAVRSSSFHLRRILYIVIHAIRVLIR